MLKSTDLKPLFDPSNYIKRITQIPSSGIEHLVMIFSYKTKEHKPKYFHGCFPVKYLKQ
jgi:hypothetical protein